MDNGERFHKAFESGMTYSEIGVEFRCPRNSVASAIYYYRKENGIVPKYRKMSEALKKSTLKKKSGVFRFDEKQRKIRQDELKKCDVREDGVILCPTRTCAGFGFDNKGGIL